MKPGRCLQKIVVIGGGTGSYVALRGLKKYPVDITAVVSMMDSGGSTGRLRDEYGYLPAGDVRRCLLALSNDSSMLRKVFEYRFKDGGLAGHNMGNLFLTALREITGSEEQAILEASMILSIKGRVLPVTIHNAQLAAQLDNNQVIVGETNLDIPKHNPMRRIKKLMLVPHVSAYKESVKAILSADKIIIGPGDLYTSVLPNLLVRGISQAIAKSNGKKIFVCNIMTKHGETTGFGAKEFVEELEKYLGKGVVDAILMNRTAPAKKLLAEYRKEHSEFVKPNYEGMQYKVVKADLLDGINFARHDSDKLAKAIISIK
jgi:uncharacterized cofD-like protein